MIITQSTHASSCRICLLELPVLTRQREVLSILLFVLVAELKRDFARDSATSFEEGGLSEACDKIS